MPQSLVIYYTMDRSTASNFPCVYAEIANLPLELSRLQTPKYTVKLTVNARLASQIQRHIYNSAYVPRVRVMTRVRVRVRQNE